MRISVSVIFCTFFIKNFAEKLIRPNILLILADDLGFADLDWHDGRCIFF